MIFLAVYLSIKYFLLTSIVKRALGLIKVISKIKF